MRRPRSRRSIRTNRPDDGPVPAIRHGRPMLVYLMLFLAVFMTANMV